MSVSYGGDSITFADGSVTSSGWTGFKNRLINGAMVIDQRNGGASVSTPSGGGGSGVFAVDRFKTYAGVGTTILTSQQVSDAPDGFETSLKTTVNTSGTATETGIYQYIEGYNTTDLKYGTSSAKTITISFWVKSSVTGNFPFILRTTSGARSYLTTYTINASNTWEYKTITIPGETSGTINKVNSYSFICQWSFGGTNSTTSTTSTWLSSNTYNISGAVQLYSTSGATFYMTGVQFEVGSTASSFEWRPYVTELQLCQRYYVNLQDQPHATPAYYGMGAATTVVWLYSQLALPVPMRITPSPTMTVSSLAGLSSAAAYGRTSTRIEIQARTSGSTTDAYFYSSVFNASAEI